PLFDGAGFDGWNLTDGARLIWDVNGSHFISKELVLAKKVKSDLWTSKSYRDFELYVDWRLTKTPPKRLRPTFTKDGMIVLNEHGAPVQTEILDAGDSGIYLRGSSRYQVNIWSQPMGSGDINEVHKDRSVPADIRRALLPTIRADAP